MADLTVKFHPALYISSIKSLIPITLDLQNGQYDSWAALFKVQARVHDVIHHILPPTDGADREAYLKAKAADQNLWNRLDAAVLQWIYATISTDILTSILVEDDTAENAWRSVAALFQDNRNSHAFYLNKDIGGGQTSGTGGEPVANGGCGQPTYNQWQQPPPW